MSVADDGNTGGSQPFAIDDVPEPSEAPVVLRPVSLSPGIYLPPEAIIGGLDPDNWEEFVREWAQGLKRSQKYVAVKRLGGTGDHGIDVAAFLSPAGLEGDWDCFQCKHYQDPLAPSDAWPELFKILDGHLKGYCTIPRRYLFLAPKGCGRKLDRMLSTPSDLKAEFVKRLNDETTPLSGATKARRVAVRDLVQKTDMSFVDSEQIDDVLDVHKLTRYHTMRFPLSMPPRVLNTEVPTELAADEFRYTEQLIEVYQEHYGDLDVSIENVGGHVASRHFQRQREAFYAAESLRRFSRDYVPPGTFEHLQKSFYDGVVETHELSHADGLERLAKVLIMAANLPIDSNALIQVPLEQADRKGICHQLANEDRLRWVKP